MRGELWKKLETFVEELHDLSKYIYEHPEEGYQEHLSSKAHRDILKKHGFEVEENFTGLETAFKATFSGTERPKIAFLAEYDALPGIGHGCGHNLLGTVSTGAGILLSKFIGSTGGTVSVIGTPAEETSGAKVKMADEGVFNDFDVAMLAHPNSFYTASGSSLALDALKFEFFGKASHAATSPQDGINALDAVIQLFNGVNALRQQMLPTARIHGIIRDGGKAANIIPDYTCAEFYVRSADRGYSDILGEKVRQCAEGAALMTGCRLEISNYEASYHNMVTNESLSSLYCGHLSEYGVADPFRQREFVGSLDMGNVSQVCPSIHPYFGISSQKEMALHTEEFRDQTLTLEAKKNMMITICSLVETAMDVLEKPEELKKIKAEFTALK